VLDERDALLRNQLGSVKDGSSELAALTAEAEKLIKDARSEVSAMVNSKKNEKQAELDKIYNEAKLKVRGFLFCYICYLLRGGVWGAAVALLTVTSCTASCITTASALLLALLPNG
jgi:hypothetical protein